MSSQVWAAWAGIHGPAGQAKLFPAKMRLSTVAKLRWKWGAGGPLLLQMLLLTGLGSGLPASLALAAALLEHSLRMLVPESHSQSGVTRQAAGCPTPHPRVDGIPFRTNTLW